MRRVWRKFVVLTALILPPAVQGSEWPERRLAAAWPEVAPADERFAIAIPQRIETLDGLWTDEGMDAVWRLVLVVPGARSVAVSTDQLRLPPGAVLRVGGQQISAAPSRWWSLHEAGERLPLEVRLPSALRGDFVLGIDEVQAGFRDLDPPPAAKADDGCTVNFNCAASAAQQQWAQGVVALQVMNQIACTGTLVDNSGGDGRALLLTAAHCHRSNGVVLDAAQAAGSMRVFWNASTPCGGALGRADAGSPLSEGALHRAEHGDIWLVELAQPPPAAANAWWAGFDAGEAPGAAGAIGIHHAGGLTRQLLSTSETPRAAMLDGVFGSVFGLLVWRIVPPLGSAAAGASGSALLDASGRVLGTLSTGSACSASARSTLSYARLSQAWEGDGTRGGSLRPWLDPAGTGRQRTGKRYETGSVTTATAALASTAAPAPLSGGGGAFALPWWALVAALRRRRTI